MPGHASVQVEVGAASTLRVESNDVCGAVMDDGSADSVRAASRAPVVCGSVPVSTIFPCAATPPVLWLLSSGVLNSPSDECVVFWSLIGI